MRLGHIYIIDLIKTHPTYVQGLMEFFAAFSPKRGWATQAQPNGTLEIAIREGGLDNKLHSFFMVKTKATEIHQSEGRSLLMFPSEPFAIPGAVLKSQQEDEGINDV